MILFWNLLMLTSCSTGARFSKVPVTFRTGNLFCVRRVCIHTIKVKVNNFENDTMKLSVKKANLTCLWAKNYATMLQVLILKFPNGPEKVSWPFEKRAKGLEKSWIQLVLYSGKQLSHVHGLHGATQLHVLVNDLVIEGDLLRPSPIGLVKSYHGP